MYKDMSVKGAELGLLIREPDVKILEHVAGFGVRGQMMRGRMG